MASCILPFGFTPSAAFAPSGVMDAFNPFGLPYIDPAWFSSAAAALAAAGQSQAQAFLAASASNEAKVAAANAASAATAAAEFDFFKDLVNFDSVTNNDSSEGTSETSSQSGKSGKTAANRATPYSRRSSSSRPVATLPEAELNARRKKEREAKARSRQRQKERISSLEKANTDLESDNSQLEEKLRALQAELSYLKHVLSLVEAKSDGVDSGKGGKGTSIEDVAMAAVSAGLSSSSPAPAIVPTGASAHSMVDCQ